MLDAALAYLAEGRSVFPVRVDKTAKGYSKRPLCKRPMEQAFTAAELTALWPAEANAIGMELGAISRALRLDAEGPIPWLEFGEPPSAGCFQSISGGLGWMLEYVDGVRSDLIWSGEGHAELKLMSDGTFTVVPPSTGYNWLGESTFGRMPRWMLDRQAMLMLEELSKELRPTDKEPEREEVLTALSYIPADEYDRWVQVGMALKQSGYSLNVWDEWSKGAAEQYEEGACEKKWATFNKVGRTVSARSILHWAEGFGFKPTNRHEPITDVGNARILARIGEGRIGHSSSWGWLAYDGRRWSQGGDALKQVQELQKQVLCLRMEAAVKSLTKHLQSDQSSDSYTKVLGRKMRTMRQIRSHESARNIEGARDLATSEPKLSIDYRRFDQRPYALNCTNGTLDLRERALHPHSPEDYLTQLCPTNYVCDAECPRWDAFLQEVFSDADTISFIQRLLGYCLTGSTVDHVLPIWYGTGRNGKSTVVRTVIAVMGTDYACTMSSSFLAATKQQQHPTKIADLYGKRFAADLETGDGMRLDEELMKRLSGGDRLRARRMREDFWEFEPTHKLILATNYEPQVRNQDPAIWGRIRKVPFNACFLGREEPGLDDKLAAEAEGILRWMVEGCYAWQDSGLGMPKAIAEATAAYQQEQNSVKRFIGEMCKIGNEEQRSRKNVITTAYKAWCLQNSVQPVGSKAFGEALKRLSIGSNDNYYFLVLST